jgi:hypothetical protein
MDGPTTPSRKKLRGVLAQYDEEHTVLPTPLRRKMKCVAIENFVLEKVAETEDQTLFSPNTKVFVSSCQELSRMNAGSLIDRPEAMIDIAQAYLVRPLSFDSKLSMHAKHGLPTLNVQYVNAIFGGDVPNYNEKRQKQNMYDECLIKEWFSETLAICSAPGLGPNGNVQYTDTSSNGFFVRYYKCKHEKNCQFRCRLFYPIDHDPNVPKYLGPVATQIPFTHSCSKALSWAMHLLESPLSTKGLHPVLKEAVNAMAGDKVYNLPKPDEVYRKLLAEFGDDVEQLFPGGKCAAKVKNQVHHYWTARRKRLLSTRNGLDMRLFYVQDIARYSSKHELRISADYKPPPRLLLEHGEITQFTNTHLVQGETKLVPSPAAHTSLPQHQMMCLPIPSTTEPMLGEIVNRAYLLDPDSSTRNNIVVFSTFNMLRQVQIASKRFQDNMMACIDSSHGADASGGKLMSFGYVSMKWNGKGSEYRRKYYPLVFARVLEECEASALLTLSALGWAVKLLFGIVLDVKGGLISDHANSFVNAFRLFFPDRPIGQCFPHITMKVKDQSGLRKRGTPGYLKYVRDRSHLTIIHLDVIRMHECVTNAMKTAFVLLCLEYWRLFLDEKKVADTFQMSYVSSEAHSHFRYNEFGNPGDTPQCNSIERFHLSAKGSRQFEGYCTFGLSLDQMMNSEFPKLCSTISSTVGDIERSIRLFDQEACESDSRLMEAAEKMNDVDWLHMSTSDWYFCNNVGFTGYPLDGNRVESWKKARQGQFGLDSSKRLEFWEAGTSICMLNEKKRTLDNKSYWECSCVTFWKTTACCHSYIRQYGSVVKLNKRVQKQVDERKRRQDEVKLDKEDRTGLAKRYPFSSGFDDSKD